MVPLSFQELIDRAERVLNPRLVGDRWFGDVAAAIETASGNIYTGVCIDTGPTGSAPSRPRERRWWPLV